jgi:hypothetical protein
MLLLNLFMVVASGAPTSETRAGRTTGSPPEGGFATTGETS